MYDLKIKIIIMRYIQQTPHNNSNCIVTIGCCWGGLGFSLMINQGGPHALPWTV